MEMPQFVSAPPQSHPVPNGANPQTHNAVGAPQHGQHGPRHSGPDPYTPLEPSAPLPSHPQAQPPRPYYYIPSMPPPPLLQYQWPMPYPCNPFSGFPGAGFPGAGFPGSGFPGSGFPGTGFPGMGYGMVMPQFLPNPYMEAPGYMFPQSHHLPPVDYRRFHHTQVPGPYHNQYQNRRFRPPAYVPREMVNSEVQTEPASSATSARIGGLYAERSTESGRGSTATSSPVSSSGRPACTEEQNDCPTPDRNIKDDFQVDGQGCGRSTGLAAEVLKPRLAKTGHSCVGKPLEMQKRNKGSVCEDIIAPSVRRSIGNCDGWSVASNDSLVPVCSSSDREEEEEEDVVTKERRVPSTTHHESRERSLEQLVDQLCESENQIPTRDDTVAEQETMNLYSTDRRSHKSVEDYDEHGTKEREHLIRHESDNRDSFAFLLSDTVNSVASYNPTVLQPNPMPQNGFLDQLNESHKVFNDDPGSLEDSVLPRIYSASKKMNQSVWSVESLAPYFPSDEWLMRNSMLQSDRVAEEVADEGKNDLLTNGSSLKAKRNRRLSRRFSMSSVESVSVCLPLVSWFDLYSQNTSPLLSQQNSNMPFITPAHELGPHKTESEIKLSETIVENPTRGLNMEPSEREDSLAVVPKKMKASIPSAEGEQDVFEKGFSELKLFENIVEKEKRGLNMEPSEICAATIGHNRIPLTSQQNVDIFITPAIELGSHKRLEIKSEKIVENPARGLNMEPSEREDSLASPAVGPSDINASIPNAEAGEKDVSEEGSSEPEANKSPNQGALNVTELVMESSSSPERLDLTMVPNNPAKEKSPCVGQLSPNNEEKGQEPVKDFWEHKLIKLEVIAQKLDDVSPSKANMHDRGVQTGRCMVPKVKKNPDSTRMHKIKVEEDTYGHGQRNPKKHGPRRNWSQDHNRQRYADWQEEQPYNDPWNRPGKPRGGNNENKLKQR